MSMEVSLRIETGTDEVEKEVSKMIAVALYACGEAAEGYAKQDCPVDTGRLQNSITYEVDEKESAMYVGTNVEYAPYVEFRDVNHPTGEAHFLQNSLRNHLNTYQSILENALS